MLIFGLGVHVEVPLQQDLHSMQQNRNKLAHSLHLRQSVGQFSLNLQQYEQQMDW